MWRSHAVRGQGGNRENEEKIPGGTPKSNGAFGENKVSKNEESFGEEPNFGSILGGIG